MTDLCEKSGIPLERKCSPEECESCGWNPEVNARRRQEIRWCAGHGILHLWGTKEAAEEESDTRRKALKYMKMELARIASEEFR